MNGFEVYWSAFGLLVVSGVTTIVFSFKHRREELLVMGAVLTILGILLMPLLGNISYFSTSYSQVVPDRIVKGKNENVIAYLNDGNIVKTYDEAIFYLPDNEICVQERRKTNMYKTIEVYHSIVRCTGESNDGF